MSKVQGLGQGQNRFSDEDRERIFWSKVKVGNKNECWPYKEALNEGNYGRFWNGHKVIGAHRYAYEVHNKSKTPYGRLILHKCDNPICCNPDHLYEGTYLDNSDDKINRKRLNPKKFGNARFYAGEIWLIRRLKITISLYPIRYKYPLKIVARMFKVSCTTISIIWASDRYLCREKRFV